MKGNSDGDDDEDDGEDVEDDGEDVEDDGEDVEDEYYDDEDADIKDDDDDDDDGTEIPGGNTAEVKLSLTVLRHSSNKMFKAIEVSVASGWTVCVPIFNPGRFTNVEFSG